MARGRCQNGLEYKNLHMDFTLLHSTVWLKWKAHFAVGIILLRQYMSNLTHLSDLYMLVIGLYKSER